MPSYSSFGRQAPSDADAATRATDGDASLARLSAVKKGYLIDPFAALLVPRAHLQPSAAPRKRSSRPSSLSLRVLGPPEYAHVQRAEGDGDVELPKRCEHVRERGEMRRRGSLDGDTYEIRKCQVHEMFK